VEPGEVHHALGLALVRGRRMDEALEHLRKGAELLPDDGRAALAYGVALDDRGRRAEAVTVLRAAHERRPADRGLLAALAGLARADGDLEAAARWARLLADESLGDPGAEEFARDVEAERLRAAGRR
jgi:Flp pilus assembly protein TadD